MVQLPSMASKQRSLRAVCCNAPACIWVGLYARLHHTQVSGHILMVSIFETAVKKADMPAAIPNPMNRRMPFPLTWHNTHLSAYQRQCQLQYTHTLATLQNIVTMTHTTLSITRCNCPQGLTLPRPWG